MISRAPTVKSNQQETCGTPGAIALLAQDGSAGAAHAVRGPAELKAQPGAHRAGGPNSSRRAGRDCSRGLSAIAGFVGALRPSSVWAEKDEPH